MNTNLSGLKLPTGYLVSRSQVNETWYTHLVCLLNPPRMLLTVDDGGNLVTGNTMSLDSPAIYLLLLHMLKIGETIRIAEATAFMKIFADSMPPVNLVFRLTTKVNRNSSKPSMLNINGVAAISKYVSENSLGPETYVAITRGL